MSFRHVFDLWVYSQLLHDDTAKDREWRSLDLAQQSMAKMVAYSYMADLVKLVAYITEAVPGRPEQSMMPVAGARTGDASAPPDGDGSTG